MEILFFMIMFGVITMLLAQAKGYSGVLGFFAGLGLGIFGFLIFLVLPKKVSNEQSGN